ncbi:DUF4214 domain-containing protein [Campylobacter sp. 50012-21]|uniref:beta strand repeat-containing protein n=1 Tax=Campylobacter magnus TaxID=3026462 RepID=UPI002360A665|nr:DUF4214 domain-containing protein [Campylobacter magnus]MDD0847102.1 DUF4214 domain-containing protein [Campylobacter magnus]
MALTTTQVNQAFLGLLGRPATGAEAAKFAGQLDAATLAQTLLTDASFKTQLSLEAPSFKTVDLQNTDPAAFVESLYTALLGRASDAEGKTFWLSVAGATPNRADVVSQFIAAVQSQEGTADANAFATIQAEDKALASAWVESLYNNLAGRASDAEGLDFWTNAIVSFAMTPAQVAASFAAALALQGNTTEDGQNYLAKQGVADNFTASFKDFNNLLTANEKATSLNSLVTMMNGVNKDSQVEQYTEEITKFSGEYQNIKAIQFTTKDDDNLGVDPETGEPNTTSGVNFTGTYNLTDETKGTIQSSDSVTGNENYKTDTLTVNVIGYNKDDSTKQTLDLDNSLPSVTSVERLNINNGAAEVKATTLNGFDYITVNGTGKFNIIGATSSAGTGLKDIVLSSGATKEGEADNRFTTAEKVQSFKSTNGNDNVTLAGVEKSIETGAGKDTITINGTLGQNATLDAGAGNDTVEINEIAKNASIKLGAGDDKLTIKSTFSANGNTDNDGNIIATIDIDAGTGVNDELVLQNGALVEATNLSAIKSIKGVEKLVLDNQNTVGLVAHTLKASAISGQSIELSTATTHNADRKGFDLILDAKGATNIDLSKLKNGTEENVSILVKDVKSGTLNLEPAKDNQSSVKETISLDSSAKSVVINNFEAQNDKISIAGATSTGKKLDDTVATTLTANGIYGIKSGNINAKYLNETVLKTATNLGEKEVIYLFADDAAAVGGQDKSYQSKIYKVTFGSDNKVSTVELMATVNQSANKSVIDPIGGTTVVTDPENTNPVVAKGVVLSYDNTNGKSLDLTANKYAGNQPVGEDTISGASAIYVNDVSGDLTITGNAAKTVTAHLSGATGVVKKSGQTQASVDIKVGGTAVNTEGVIKTNFTTNAVTIKADALLADKDGIVEVYSKGAGTVTVESLEALTTNNIKLDLSVKEGENAVTTKVDVSGVATASDINLANTFLVDAEGINLTVASTKAVKSITGTKGDDTIKLVSGDSIASSNVSINGGSGSNTLQLKSGASGAEVDFTKITDISNINVIDLYDATSTSGAKILASAVDGDTITLKNSNTASSGNLIIDITAGATDREIDLSNFNNDQTNGVATVTITGVKANDIITLSQATGTAKIAETVDLTSIASGAVKVANAHKAEDTIKFTNAQVNGTGFTNETINVGTATKATLVASGDGTNDGLLTFAGASSAVQLSLTQAQEALTTLFTGSNVDANDVVFYKADDGNTYLINVGGTSAASDDIVVNLGATDVAKITATGNVISFA